MLKSIVSIGLSLDSGVTDKGTFNVTTDEGATLPCKVMKGTDKTSVNDNDTVLEVAPTATDKKGEETLTFAIVGDVTYSGKYTGTVTFTVSVDEATT